MNHDKTAITKIRTGPMFAVMLAGALVAFLNQTLINIALPQLMTHFDISAATANWLTTIFLLVNGIVIPITAFLMERFNTKQLYLASMGLFALGTFYAELPQLLRLIDRTCGSSSRCGDFVPVDHKCDFHFISA